MPAPIPRNSRADKNKVNGSTVFVPSLNARDVLEITAAISAARRTLEQRNRFSQRLVDNTRVLENTERDREAELTAQPVYIVESAWDDDPFAVDIYGDHSSCSVSLYLMVLSMAALGVLYVIAQLWA